MVKDVNIPKFPEGKERRGEENNGKEKKRKGKERKGKERKGEKMSDGILTLKQTSYFFGYIPILSRLLVIK